MAAESSTTTRAAGCGSCGQPEGRHIWGPERAMLSGAGCDGWEEGASASSTGGFGDPDFGPGGYFVELPDEAETARNLADPEHNRADGTLSMEGWDAFTADLSRMMRKAVA